VSPRNPQAPFAAQGIAGSAQSAAVRSEHAGSVSPAARKIQARPQDHGLPASRGDDLAEMQAEALRQGMAAPFRQLTAELPEWSMHIPKTEG